MIVANDANGFRWYTDAKGTKYVSVTQAMDHVVPKFLQNWMKKNSVAKIDKIKSHSADHGTSIHKELEDLFFEQIAPTSPSALKALELLASDGYSIVDCEQEVFSDEYGYAGRLDLIVKDKDGNLGVGDLKTGNSFSIKTGWQLSAYLMAYNAMNPTATPLTFMLGVHIPRDKPSRGKLFRYSRINFCFMTYLSCLQTFKGVYWNELKKANWQWLERPIFLE